MALNEAEFKRAMADAIAENNKGLLAGLKDILAPAPPAGGKTDPPPNYITKDEFPEMLKNTLADLNKKDEQKPEKSWLENLLGF